MLITREPDRLRLTGYTWIAQIRHYPESRVDDASPKTMERGGLRWGIAGGALIPAAMQAQSLDSDGVP